MTYIMTYRGGMKDFRVRVAVSKVAAQAFLTSVTDPAVSATVVDNHHDLALLSKSQLVGIYNALGKEGDTAVAPTAFASRSIGAERVLQRLDQNYRNSPAMVAEESASDEAQPPETAHEESTDMATKA